MFPYSSDKYRNDPVTLIETQGKEGSLRNIELERSA